MVHSRSTLPAVLLLVLQTLQPLSAQDPPGIDWKVIDAEHYRIIFPAEMTSEANRVANTVEYTYGPVARTLGGRHQRIPLLLSNRGAVPNGYVRRAPWMSEWFNVPLALKEMGSSEWYQDLALHETRHMVQLTYLNRGINRLLYLLGGEGGAMGGDAFFPGWYWEGDAVAMETALSRSGRGRMPYFTRQSRSLLREGIRYGYHKALYGSYRDACPGPYEMGYLLTTHVKRRYGAEAWPAVLRGTMHWPVTLNPLLPFSRALKRTTGRTASQIYGDAMDELSGLWQAQRDGLKCTAARILSPEPHRVRTDYDHPGFDGDGLLYATRSGMGETTSLVRLTGGGAEQVMQLPAVGAIFGASINGGKVACTELQPDVRWSKLSWANVVLYDIETGERRQLTRRARYYCPALSTNGERVAAVEFTETRACYLVILDAVSGAELGRFESPNGGMILFPSWSPDGREIAFTAHRFRGKGIFTLDVATGRVDTVAAESFEDVLRPVFFGNYLLYESPRSGIDNIYAIDRVTGERWQVTSREIGAYNPVLSPDGHSLVFNDFSRLGNRVAAMALDPGRWLPVDQVEDRTVDYLQPVLEQEKGGDIMAVERIPHRQYEVAPYRGISRYLNIHSWNGASALTAPNLTGSLYSLNVLGTVQGELSATYNTNENVMFYKSTLSYFGWYPALSVSARRGTRASRRAERTGVWKETDLDLSAAIPLINRRRGYHATRATLAGTIGYWRLSDRREHLADGERDLPGREAVPLSYRLSYQRWREGAARDLVARGRRLSAAYRHSPLGDHLRGSQLSGSFAQYWLGPCRHHGVALLADAEANRGDDYWFLSGTSAPVGYPSRSHRRSLRVRTHYKLPLLYPDWGILGITYLKRVYGSAFADGMRGWDRGKSKDYLSVGLALSAELGGILDVPLPPLPLSIAYAYRPSRESGAFRFSMEF